MGNVESADLMDDIMLMPRELRNDVVVIGEPLDEFIEIMKKYCIVLYGYKSQLSKCTLVITNSKFTHPSSVIFRFNDDAIHLGGRVILTVGSLFTTIKYDNLNDDVIKYLQKHKF